MNNPFDRFRIVAYGGPEDYSAGPFVEICMGWASKTVDDEVSLTAQLASDREIDEAVANLIGQVRKAGVTAKRQLARQRSKPLGSKISADHVPP